MSSSIMNVMIGALFLAFFYQIFKNRNGGGMSTGRNAGKPTDSKKKSGGFFGSKGGMGDMFNVGKSNAKQFGGDDG